MIGPKDRWQFELEKASKSGLISMIEMLVRFRILDADRNRMLDLAWDAKTSGLALDLRRRIDDFLKNPTDYTKKSMRRAAAARKSARRRKREKARG